MAKDFTRRRFARSVLKKLNIEPTDSAMQAMLGWMAAEGGHWNNTARYNPLNTTQNMPGSGDTGTQGNISVYRSPRQGVRATVKTLKNGNYGGILHALKTPGVRDDIAAIDRSPWGTHGSLVARAIESAPKNAGGGGGTIGRYGGGRPGSTTTITETVPDVAANSAIRRQAALAYLTSGNSSDSLLQLATTLAGANQTTTTTRRIRRPGASRGGSDGPGDGSLPKHRQPSALYEMFWQGPGGINIKNGQRQPMGFVDGHTEHVHLAANRKAVVKLGKLAQKMGLHVGENPHFGGVNPVHVNGSYHYKNQAIDVSGDPALMRKFAHRVARIYGIR